VHPNPIFQQAYAFTAKQKHLGLNSRASPDELTPTGSW
jgi:hypothetical protein